MKRNDALNAIHDALYDYFGESYPDQISYNILSRLEELGMQPPIYKKYDINEWCGLSGNDPIEDAKLAYGTGWEPE